jgi:hypothetical protein
MRGIIADMLWMRAIRMEEMGRSYEIIALLDGILQMQPHFTSVWAFQARVLVFDFGSALENPDPAEAYRWIRKGIEVLEEGARRNPTSHVLDYALADVYLRKLSPRSVDSNTWQLLLREFYKDQVELARKESRRPPDFDRFLGLDLARAHYLKAASKPDISRSRKLLCRRLAIRCLERKGNWRTAENEWRKLVQDLESPRFFGKDSPAYLQNVRFFREFMRHLAAFELEFGSLSASRKAHARMKSYFDNVPGLKQVIAEEIRALYVYVKDRKGAARLYRKSVVLLQEERSLEEIVN